MQVTVFVLLNFYLNFYQNETIIQLYNASHILKIVLYANYILKVTYDFFTYAISS